LQMFTLPFNILPYCDDKIVQTSVTTPFVKVWPRQIQREAVHATALLLSQLYTRSRSSHAVMICSQSSHQHLLVHRLLAEFCGSSDSSPGCFMAMNFWKRSPQNWSFCILNVCDKTTNVWRHATDWFSMYLRMSIENFTSLSARVSQRIYQAKCILPNAAFFGRCQLFILKVTH